MTSETEKGPLITGDQLLFAVLFLGKLTSSREKLICPEILILLEPFSDVIFVYFSEFCNLFLFVKYWLMHINWLDICVRFAVPPVVFSHYYLILTIYIFRQGSLYYLHNIWRASQVFHYWFIALNDITTRLQLLCSNINNFIDHISL